MLNSVQHTRNHSTKALKRLVPYKRFVELQAQADTPAKILVFDSGVGGLSIVQEIRQLLPQEQLLYLADTAAFPYGLKSETFLKQRIQTLLMGFCQQQQPDIIVVACNSASTLVLPLLREQLNIPVVGVVPAIKPAAAASTSKQIALLATPGTVSRSYTRQLINDWAGDCRVHTLGSADMVRLAEDKLAGRRIDLDYLRQLLLRFNDYPIDHVVLGCTHFPLLRPELELAFNDRPWTWVDSGAAVARRVSSLLNRPTCNLTRQIKATNRAYYTQHQPSNRRHKEQHALYFCFQQFGFNSLQNWFCPSLEHD